MGTLSYIQLYYIHNIKFVRKFQNAKGIRTHQASQPQQGAGRFNRSQEGREALKARGRQTYLGLPQGESCRTLRTNSFSPLTLRCSQSSARRRFALLAWRSTSRLT